ncbi:hypothetical protein HPB51_027207 [Rhipicephalus microplus]|uniref:Uncharacterized protein n=1 Tax=Rhipicephalus microplus TaxID=6941 RepID=A0A9J6D0V4_RHIMP|nr:hypothetical protein HPB51_027207 [Rhipicephalus microplus]
MTYLDELLLRTRRTNAIQPWISAIAKNTLLHNLVIDLQGFAVEECCEFFRAVAASNTLQRVIVRNITVFKDLREAFNCMNSHLLSRKVLLDDLHVRPLNIPALPECTLVTTVTLSYNHIEKGQEFRSAFSVLMKCPHVTSLSVHTLPDIYEESLMNDIAAYIRVVPTLKNFELRFTVGHHVFASQYQRSESSLMRALASNTNLQKLTLSLTLSKMDCHRLAIAALRIPTLSDLSLVDCGYGVNECFTPLFAQRMTSNYNLLHVELPECRMYHTENIIVQDVTRRNCGLIARALRFVLGDRDPLCASALERVCGHAKLVELVEDRAVVETTEAIAMIKRALNSIRGLQEYMTLSGVVKNSVQSLRQRDGETNLVDLNEYCWLHIRQYLTLEDVAKASNK